MYSEICYCDSTGSRTLGWIRISPREGRRYGDLPSSIIVVLYDGVLRGHEESIQLYSAINEEGLLVRLDQNLEIPIRG